MLKINNGSVITLKDDSPNRNTNKRSNVTVSDLIKFEISDQLLEQFNDCNELVIQFYGKPITIPAKGISEIKKFINS